MNPYSVKYYYLFPGSGPDAEFRDYGIVYAESATSAIDIVGVREFPGIPKFTRNFGLEATLVSENTDHIKITKINELSELINLKNTESNMKYTDKHIVNTDNMINAICTRQYIVGSFTTDNGFSAAVHPVPHTSRASARQECNRLSKITPGKLYIFLELSGAELSPIATATSY